MVAMPVSDGIDHLSVVLNALGASGFGIAMICLFAIYPRHLPRALWICAATLIGFGGWTLLILFGPNPAPETIQLITLVEMILIMALALWQVLRPHRDPAQRAIAIWLGVSVLFGAGPFIGLVALPLTFGFANLIDENLAFSSFLLIYLGLAIGLVRYRLFDLGTWAYRLLFYAGAAVAVLALDLALIGLVAMKPNAAFTTTLLITAFAWLPFRDFLWQRVTNQSGRNEANVFASIVGSVLQPTLESRAAEWRHVLQELFQPLEISQDRHHFASAQLGEDGNILHVPSVMGGPALTLRHSKSGAALFSRRDCDLAQQFVILASHVDESRNAYDQGVSEERTRIARDIHDNIGAHLMRALHSEHTSRKDDMIRETLSDLRDIINNAATPGLLLETVASDLRAETADRLQPHDIALTWQFDVGEDVQPSQALLQMIRAVIREATSNAIKHANPSQFSVKLAHSDQSLHLSIKDNGKGIDPILTTKGHGLENMRGRFDSLGGKLALTSDATGTRLLASVPLIWQPHDDNVGEQSEGSIPV